MSLRNILMFKQLCALLLLNFATYTFSCITPCSLTKVNGSPLITGSGQASSPSNVSYSLDGSLLAVTDFFGDTVSLFTVSSTDCSILESNSVRILSTGTGPARSAFSPDGAYLAIANLGSGNVTVYTIATGEQVPGSPFSTGGMPISTASVAYSADGSYLAASNATNGSIYLFQVQFDGSLLQTQLVQPGIGYQISKLTFNNTSGKTYLAAANRGRLGSSTNLGSVLLYELLGNTLTLTSEVTAGSNPYAVAFSPDDAFLAAANYSSNDISVYAVDILTGQLSQIPDSPFIADALQQTTISYNVSGTCLAINSPSSNEVIVFSTDPVTGMITTPGTKYTAGIAPFGLAYSPVDSCLAVGAANGVTVFSGSATSCDLGTSNYYTIGSGHGSRPFDVTFSPNNQFLAITNSADDTVSVFSVSASGQLTSVSGSPYATGIGSIPLTLAYSPSGRFLATANTGNNTITMFLVGQNGTLQEITGTPFATGTGPKQIAFSPNGNYLAVSNYGDNTVTIFAVTNTGSLIEIAGSPFATGNKPQGLAFAPNGQNLTVINTGDSTATVFNVTNNGSLTEITGSPYATGTFPAYVSYSPDGNCLSITRNVLRPGVLDTFSVSDEGSLTPTAQSPYTIAADPLSREASMLAYSPNGRCLAVASTGGTFAAGSVTLISNNTCELSTVSSYQPGYGPNSVAYSPNGKFLAAVTLGSGTITLYKTNCFDTTISALAQAIINKYC